jgi:hypothetical protein
MDIISAIQDSKLLGALFKDKSTWASWFCYLKSLFALPMDEGELNLYKKCTGRSKPPEEQFSESYVIAGRRSGKSFMAAVIAVYLALFRDYTPYLNVGEVATIMVIGPDKYQAANTLRYIKNILHTVAIFREKVIKERAMDIELLNRVHITVKTCSYVTVRGFTLGAVVAEEMSFWRSDTGVHIDSEVVNALMPGLSKIPGSIFCGISSPYGRQGALYSAHRDYFGRDEQNHVLVWHSPTRVLNPTISEDYIKNQLERDPEAGRAEWLAEFRQNLESFLPLRWIEDAIVPNRFRLESQPGVSYSGFVDMSGGVGDFSVLSIGHREGNELVQDVLEAVPAPHNPNAVIKQFAQILKDYQIKEIGGDKYSANFVKEGFADAGIRYIQSKETASDLYIEFGGLLATGKVQLLDDQKLFGQLRILERRLGRGGKDRVTHPPRTHDDHANATAGLLVNLNRTWPNVIRFDWLEGAKSRVIAQAAH